MKAPKVGVPSPGATVAAGPQSVVHASAVALEVAGDWRGVLITGASGAGKSALALALMAHGARLVADDRVILSREGGQVLARAPAAIAGRIEARGIGILRADVLGSAGVGLVVGLDGQASARLPPARRIELNGIALPYLCCVWSASLAAAVLQAVRGGVLDPDHGDE